MDAEQNETNKLVSKPLDKLFFMVWRNKYIRSIIIDNHLRKFNLFHCRRYVINRKVLEREEAQYYRSIELKFIYKSYNHISLEMFKLLSDSVRIVKFASLGFDEPLKLVETIPPTVTSLDFSHLTSNDNHTQITGPIPNTLKSLILGGPVYNKMEFNSFENSSLTHLDIGTFIIGCDKSGSTISLPNTLKSFICRSKNLKSFNIDCLPLSITHLDFNGSYLSKFKSGNVKSESDLSSLLNLQHLSIGQFFTNKIPIGFLPNSLKVLKLSYIYDPKRLKPLSIPSSVTELGFCNHSEINSPHASFKVSPIILPLSLIKLSLGSNHCFKFTKDDNTNNLLMNLNKISFAGQTYSKCKLIPKSVSKLRFFCRISERISVPNNIQSLSLVNGHCVNNLNELNNLAFLKIRWASINLNINSLILSNLKTLLCDNNIINELLNNNNNIFMSLRSLSTLDFKYDPICFPSLTLLELDTKLPIDTKLLPSSLKILIIRNSPDIILPISPNIETIYINYSSYQPLLENLNLFENFHLLNIFKVVDLHVLRSYSKLFRKLSII